MLNKSLGSEGARSDCVEMERRLAENEAERERLERELKARERVIASLKLNVETQEQLNLILSQEKSKQELYIRLLLEGCPDMIFLFDNDMKFLMGTQSLATIMQIRSVMQLKGRSFDALVERYHPKCWDGALRDALARIIAGQSGEERLDAVSGGQSYEILGLPFSGDEGERLGALVLMHDVTELAQAKDAAVRASRTKSDFLAAMSHEIRTPMNAIIGLLDFIKQDPLTPRQAGYLDNVHKAARSLLTIINDILDFSKIEAGKMTLVPTDFDLHKLLDNIRTLSEVAAHGKGLSFVCDFHPNVPRFMHCDENRLRQAINNLVSNAVKYTEQGEVLLKVRAHGDILRIRVRDTGIGIRAEDRERLFQPFEQFDRARNRNITGTGLGLAITSQICRTMGGCVTVNSEYGKGTEFTIELPLVRVADMEAEPEEADAEFYMPGAKVLVVDDIDVNLIVATAILNSFGIEPDTALSGARAIELAREKEYDLVFMDHMMPEMDGIEAAAGIRALAGHNAKVPIVALTANAISGMDVMFLNHGLNDYLSKPIDMTLMQRCLTRWLGD